MYDIAIIGAGPSGLFAVFEAGMLKMKCAVIDTLDFIGGQCTALYPEKPIYDIPAIPKISAQDLIKNLEEQIARFEPTYYLGHQVISIAKHETNFTLTTNIGQKINAKSVIIASGGGSFGPNRPPLSGIENFEGKSVFYMISDRQKFANSDIVIAGGGDSAVDWAISLSEIAKSVKIVHRRDKFKALDDSIDKLQSLVKLGKIELITPYQLHSIDGTDGQIESVNVATLQGEIKKLKCDYLLPFFGLSMDIGPLKNWGLDFNGNYLSVDSSTMKTSMDGICAIGDICTYAGKLKFILTGFAEAALATHSIKNYLNPHEISHFEYSTTMFNK